MLPEQGLPRAAPELQPGGVLFCGFALGQRGIQTEQRGQVVRFCGRRQMERSPEPGHAVPGLPAELALAPYIDRRVGPELEAEDVGVVGDVGPTWKLEQAGDAVCLRARRFGHGRQGAKEFRLLTAPWAGDRRRARA